MQVRMVADSANRRSFVGGSDARIIMGDDDAALLRLWREKRGEAIQARLKPASITIDYFPRFSFTGVRSRTPGPPPFSSMNTTPSRIKTSLIELSVAGSPAYRPTSMFEIVFRCKPVAAAKSLTVQFSAALAILTCALVTGFLLCYCHMCTEHK